MYSFNVLQVSNRHIDICMKKLYAEKLILTNVQHFELTVFHPFKCPGHLQNRRDGALISSPEPKAHG